MYSQIAGVNAHMVTMLGAKRITSRDVQSGTVYDPTITPVAGEVTGLLAKFTKDTIDGEVQAGDAILVCLPTDDILTHDKVTINGETWRVVRLLPIKPGSIDLLKRAHIRK